jgi:exo-1,4-beta-D-glucosaminidase
MSRFDRFILFAVAALSFVVAPSCPAQQVRTYLHKGWQLQSACDVNAKGDEISQAGFDASKWHQAEIPATVVGALIADKTYPDPNFGTNLRDLPGMNYSNKSLFANQDFPKGSPFACAWWFRTEFSVPAGSGDASTNRWLNFLGVNYRANIWVNGQKIADERDIAGTYRSYEFDVTKTLVAGQANGIALEISAPRKNDLGITWVDWNPTPPDKNMGIWKEVFLTTSGPVTVRDPFVSSLVDNDLSSAQLTVIADLHNASRQPVQGVLNADLEGIKVSQPVSLAAGETKTVRFTPESFAELRLSRPRLWWPYTMGEPVLNRAKLDFSIGSTTSDAAETWFGIRTVSSELTPEGHLLFKINGRNILIRGAAWAPDLFFRWSSEKLQADLDYVRDMGMNAVRLEGRLDREELYERADRMGILVMPGWTCCDAWERWTNWKDEQHKVSAESLKSVIRILRKHPSVFVWLNGSDNPPPAAIERNYLAIEKELDWPNPIISSASESATTVTGKSGVKMTGPYEYVPPVYWLADQKWGGAHGYNTETSPGPAIPPKESLEKFIPKEHLWPIDDVWNFHAGGERFTTVNVFTDGLTRRYGAPTSLDDYLRKAQAMTYDGERAMFEAYARNKYRSTGVIQWMLNNGWPSLIWHLYDYYLVPAGGYFGTKKACEPVHVQYSWDDNSVAVINSTYKSLKGMHVIGKLINGDGTEKGTQNATLDLDPDSSKKAFDLPKVDGPPGTYFLKLELHNSSGALVSDNFYWLSTKLDTLAWDKRQDTAYTPQKDFADLTGLNNLPPVTLDAKFELGVGVAGRGALPPGPQGGSSLRCIRVTVKNSPRSIAFMVHLRATRGPGGDDITPIFWQDNYFSLLSGETRQVSACFAPSALGSVMPAVEVNGYNVTPTRATPP